MESTTKPRAKGKIKIAHEKAIADYQQWLAERTDFTTTNEKFQMFNFFVDMYAA